MDRLTSSMNIYLSRNLWISGENDLHIFFCYSCADYQYWCLQLVFQLTFWRTTRYPTLRIFFRKQSVGLVFRSVTFFRFNHYVLLRLNAFFKGYVLWTPPRRYNRGLNPYYHLLPIRNLSCCSGLLSSRRLSLSPTVWIDTFILGYS